MNLEAIKVKAEILVHKAPSEVFDAFARPDTMSKFWLTRRDEGLQEGETISWFVGENPEAIEIQVRVKTIDPPNKMVMEWGEEGKFTTQTWTFEEQGTNTTLLRVEEIGFSGSDQEIIDYVLDSTGGFNQVIVAAKALLEHGAVVNVVADHAKSCG